MAVTVAGVILLASAALALAAPRAAGSHRGAGVRSVSSPPAQVPKRLRLVVGTRLSTVSVYASPGRKLVKGALRIASRAHVRRHRVTAKVPGKVGAGLWFVVVCPPTGHGACAASRKPMQRIATKLSPPVEAHPAQETSNAATATIGSAGGTLDATAADGTRFHLVIAANSVPDGTQITMTPVSALGNVGSAKFVAGVQLAPEGLFLIHGGTLTIIPSHQLPIASQVGYGYDGAGDDVHRVPLLPTRAIVIPLAHFSGVGLLAGAAESLAGTGSAILDRYSALIAQETYAVRLGYISEQAAFADCQKLLRRALGELNAQEVPPGLDDDDAAEKAIKDLLAVAHTSALLGDKSEGMFQAVKPTVYKLMEGIYDRAQQKCAQQHDLTQIPKIIDTDHREMLLNGDRTGHGLQEDLKCMQFRIDFDSTIDVIAGSGGSGGWHLEYTAHPTVTVDVSQAPVGDILTGSTTGTYADASGTMTADDGTTATVTSGTGDTFDVVRFEISPDPTQPATLTLNVHSPSEEYHNHDPANPGDDFDDSEQNWLLGFDQFHRPHDSNVVLQLERVAGDGDLYARGTFSNSSTDGSATEATTIDVFHTPPPA